MLFKRYLVIVPLFQIKPEISQRNLFYLTLPLLFECISAFCAIKLERFPLTLAKSLVHLSML